MGAKLRYNRRMTPLSPSARPLVAVAIGSCALVWLTFSAARAQPTDVFQGSLDHPAISYLTAPLTDPVAALNEQLEQGSLQLAFDNDTGYLRATLDALKISVDSQSLVFSKTSAQAKLITLENPRALYFNDTAAVGWVRGADVLELAAHDPKQGVVFYTIVQTPSSAPRFARNNSCLLCHVAWETLAVPGILALSTFQMSDDPLAYASGFVVDHRSPLDKRWGGWYVTGKAGSVQHVGNIPVVVPAEELKEEPGPTPQLESVAGLFDTGGYPSLYSDVVALMVMEHQTHMTNLMTWLGWEARVALYEARPKGGRRNQGEWT